MFFSQSPTIIFIKKNSLEFWTGGVNKKIGLPTTLVVNLEIKDQENYKKLINSFLTESSLKSQKAVLLLSNEVIFKKEFPAGTDKDILVEKFLDNIPFEKEKIAKKIASTPQTTTVFVVNKNIYEVLLNLLEELGWNIKAVVPVEVDNLDSSSVDKISSDSKLIKSRNLLDEDISETTEESGNHSTWIFIIVGLLIVGALALGLAVFTGFVKNPFDQPKVESPKVVTETITSLATPTPEESSQSAKEELKLQILNGSGVAGQAGFVKEKLEEIGFTNIETGNAVGTGSDETVVAYLDTVSTEVLEELVKELEEIFVEVSKQEAGEVGDYDIIITTGSSL
jgi:hypothetical protein